MPHGQLDDSLQITLGHLNISGWTQHNNELRKRIFSCESLDIFFISETHLSDNVDFEPNVPGYIYRGFNRTIMHKNAPGTWGGVGFLIKTNLLNNYEFRVIEKSYEGIFAIELVHKITNIRVLLIACYLPPESSPYGRNVDGFMAHIEQLCYSYSAECDYIMFAGDMNARIGTMRDIETDIDMSLPDRKPLDNVSNSHGHSFIQLLKDCKMCVLNGRFEPQYDNFTFINSRGKSVVDYFFCSHKMLENCTDFRVITCKDLANMYQLSSLIGNRSKLPDHSLIKVCLNIAYTPPVLDNNDLQSVRDTNNFVQSNANSDNVPKYNVKNVPNEFFSCPESCRELIQLINNQEMIIENQQNVDDCYDKLIAVIFSEMDRYLPKLYGYNKGSSKRFKVKKPYWNNHLKALWVDMCKKEKDFLRYKGPNHIKQFFRKQFADSSLLFNKELRKAERCYNKKKQDEIENICTENPRQFWNYIKKLGPQFSKKIPEEVYDEFGNINTNLHEVMTKWKTEYEKLYKPESDNFDNDFYREILELLRNAENRMKDPLYVPNPYLNNNISTDEINHVIDRLKNRKAPGIDNIPNEVLKCRAIKNCLRKLFQYYFDTGLLPSCWNKAIIKPIPKSRSKDPRVPLNYRGINLLSCIYKAYGSVINRRLTNYLEQNSLLEDVQNGFRPDRNCIDHIYVLHSIIKNRKNNSRDTFVAYIDFFKCFDLIDRNLLFFKLTEYGIDGKMYDTLKRMYSNTQSCVNINNNLTDWFKTENGCRQGDVISPTAFSIIINDLLKELNVCGIGVKLDCNLTLSVLAFADDIVLLAESADELQRLIDIVYRWSNKWRFMINPEKSQVVHYRNAPKAQTDFIFKLCNNGPTLEKVSSYKYLGVYLDEHLTFTKTTDILATAGGRALGAMINKYKSLDMLGYDTYTKLYDSLVSPVTDYGSAIWGTKSYDSMDRVQNRATRFFMGVHRFSPIAGHVGDMGWISNRGRWKSNIIRLWNRLVGIDGERLLKRVFLWDMEQHNVTNKANFSANAKQILIELDRRQCYLNLEPVDIEHCKKVIYEKDKINWSNQIKTKSKLDFLASIKTEFGVEPFVTMNISRYERSILAQLRYGILQIRLETGRYSNEKREDRLCKICNGGVVEDQCHFVLHCPAYIEKRGRFDEIIKTRVPNWELKSDSEKFVILFRDHTRIFARFVKELFLYRKSLIYK